MPDPITPPAGAPPASTPPAAAPNPSPAPWYGELFGQGGAINKTAWDKAPEAFKPYVPTFQKYNDLESLLLGFGNASQFAGRKALLPLPDNAPPEARAEMEAHLRSLNRVPEKPEGYGLKRPEDLPEEAWNPQLAQEFSALAHKHAISPQAVSELMAMQVGSTKSLIAQAQAQQAAYFSEQGKAIDQLAQSKNMTRERANDVAKRGADLLGISLENPGFQTVEIYSACLKAAELMGSEGKLVSGDAPESSAMDERGLALDIMNNPQNPLHKAYNDPMNPVHKHARAKVDAYYEAWGKKQNRR